MSDNDRKKEDAEMEDNGESPGAAFIPFIEMDQLSNKLKFLDYDNEYLLKWKMKPLSRYIVQGIFALESLQKC